MKGAEERGGRKHVVVCIDDEREILSTLERVLRDEPFEFLTTAEPEEALDWVRSRDVSLIISDYRMPELSGTSLLQVVKALSPGTIRVMLTAYPGEPVVQRARERGLMLLLTKPWDEASLRKTIREHLALLEPGETTEGCP